MDTGGPELGLLRESAQILTQLQPAAKAMARPRQASAWPQETGVPGETQDAHLNWNSKQTTMIIGISMCQTLYRTYLYQKTTHCSPDV